MENRGRKRTELLEQLPADKRACSVPDYRPTSSSHFSSVSKNLDYQMEVPSSPCVSGRSDKDSAYGSCDSDGPDQDYHCRNSDEPNSKFKKILTSLSEEAGSSSHLGALTELCDILLMSTESSLSGFSGETFVPALITLMKHDTNPNIMLFAARALTYICDVMPRSALCLVRHDAVPLLVAPLLGIEYLDVAEQCLQALEKISRVQPGPCLQAGAVMAVLNYVDFFSPSSQRVALSTITNICKRLPSDSYSFVNEAVPVLCNILQYEDHKLVDIAVICLIHMVESLNATSEMIEDLCKHGLVQHLAQLTSSGRISLSRPAYIGLIGMLARLASVSYVAVRVLLEMNISTALKNIIVVADSSHAVQYSSAGVMDADQVNEALKLLNTLLPPMDDGNPADFLEKDKLLIEHPDLLHQFGRDMLPSLMQVVSSGASSAILYGCICILNKLIYYSRTDILLDLLNMINISSFLAGVFTRKNQHVLISALKTAELIMEKLPGILLNSFIKEGVLYAIDALQMSEKFSCMTVQKLGSDPITSGPDQKKDRSAKEASKCLCHFFDALQEAGMCKVEHVSVQAVAKHLREAYFSEVSSSSSVGFSEMHQKLSSLSELLSSHVETSAANDECFQHDILLQIMTTISSTGDSLSTFEFVESGIVSTLANYLSYPYTKRSGVLHSIVRRSQVFARISLLSECVQYENIPLIALLQKLQRALCSVEHFTLVLNPATKIRDYYANIPPGHHTKHPCLKILFIKGEGEDLICDYSQDVQLVEPFLSIVDIESFLWPKVCNSKEERERQNTAEYAKGLVRDSQSASKRTVDMTETVCGESASFRSAEKHLIFFLDGKQLNRSLTLYQSILQHLVDDEHDVTADPSFWNEIYKLTYRKAANFEPAFNFSSESQDVSLRRKCSFSEILVTDVSFALDKSDIVCDILVLLKTLHSINRNGFHLISQERSLDFAEGRINNLDEVIEVVPVVPCLEFISSRLTEKLEQQMQDPLASCPGGMPSWCSQLVTSSPFLFSFEARRKYFHLAAADSLRPQSYLSSCTISTSNSDRNSSSGRLVHVSSGGTRERFQVDRADIMGSTLQIMNQYASSSMILEIEYKEEVGSGLGPTLEFYTLVSHEFQKVGLGMWREDPGSADDSHGIVMAPFGLFPCPWSATLDAHRGTNFSEVINNFGLLGQVVAKALKDGRFLDLPFSSAFYKLMLGKDLNIYDILTFDPALGRTLIQFEALANRKRFLDSLPPGATTVKLDLCFHNTRIEDICLDFTLPGYTEYKLVCGQEYKQVNIDNLDDYVSLVVDATVKSGISRQIEAFKAGFNQVHNLSALRIFSEEELECLLCGERDAWISEEQLDHIKFDHGYTATSPPICYLLEIVREFNCHERRAFLQFVTGAPRLPPGGVAALKPKLTIVRKHCSGSADGDLPSVMTCANYLKLPPYSSKERMQERFLYAITEGQGSFHLS